MATSAATVAAAIAARARRQVREYFEKQNALDEAHAVSYEAPDRMHERQAALLVRRGILKETGDGRYWLDLAAVQLERERAKAAARTAFLILAIGIAILIAVVAIANA